MSRKILKNSNSIFDVALSMWLCFSLFLRNWQVLRQQRAITSKNKRAAKKPLKVDSFKGANLEILQYATFNSGNRKDESFCLVPESVPVVPQQLASWMWTLPNNCYRRDCCILLWFYGYLAVSDMFPKSPWMANFTFILPFGTFFKAVQRQSVIHVIDSN